ncbi:type 1 glutamine amidotransferase domain-containing protein [Falsirhodobacter algicola]|uniref:DJ-1/PfpI/YhbO family deglycase/protease n=1 Tax=Falsirhodobacter algicola TaxID=2692330 RepID=A0A8J8MR98_9RHOB|nr:type 1 glutamine amidotransferase domain-containing protein [Falsirhodobacter algicola]QUS34911.1 DJ-1/PfpI/YhbO family deglycase/protease [Falsirhodobacter algicola]
MALDGKTVAILIAPQGTEEVEFTKPKEALEQAGASVVVVSLKDGPAKAVNGDLEPGGEHAVHKTIGQVRAEDFDGIVIPGGTVGADRLRADKGVVALVHEMVAQGKPVAAICHGPWVLVEAGIVKGRELTSFPSLQTDIRNAGGTWTDAEVVTDSGLVTSRKPDDLPAFCAKLVEEIGEGRHSKMARSA